jgi:Spy/CpxP family protein refolding chaperone
MTPKLKSWLVLALIFLAGVVSGGALSLVLAPHFLRPPPEAMLGRHMMERLTHELQLTADQQAKIEPIIMQTTRQIHEVHSEEVGRISQIMKAANDQLAPILTPDQKAQLDKIESEGGAREFFQHQHGWGEPGQPHFHDDDKPGPPPPPAPPATNAPPK